MELGGGELSANDNKTTPWAINTEMRTDLKKIVFTEPVIAPENSSALFSAMNYTINPGMPAYKFGLKGLTDIEGLAHLDISKTKYFNFMFANAASLKSLDLSNFNLSLNSIDEHREMFIGANKIERVTISDQTRIPYGQAPGNVLNFVIPKDKTIYTGKWTLEDGSLSPYDSLADNKLFEFGKKNPGTYVWEKIPATPQGVYVYFQDE